MNLIERILSFGVRAHRHDRMDVEPTDVPQGAGSTISSDIVYGANNDFRQWLEEQLRFETDRIKRYKLYDRMDETDLAASVLDLYAEDATPRNADTGDVLWFESRSPHIMASLNAMKQRLRLDENAFEVCRSIAKNGDSFDFLSYESGVGVHALHPIHPGRVQRINTLQNNLHGFRLDGNNVSSRDRGKDNLYKPYQIIHWRLPGRTREHQYGTSILLNARRAWRQLMLGEDHILMLRMRRAPDRWAFFLDTGEASHTEKRRQLKNIEQKFRRDQFIDPEAPTYRSTYDPMTAGEDLFVAVRQNSATKVVPLQGSDKLGEIHDLEFYRDKFFAAVRVPKAYMGFEGDTRARATLSNQNVRYARSAERLQRAYVAGIRRIAEIHLLVVQSSSSNDYDYDFTLPQNRFEVRTEPVSYLAELERLELLQTRANVASVMMLLSDGQGASLDPASWTRWIAANVLNISDARLDAIVGQAAADPDADTPAAQSNVNSASPGEDEAFHRQPSQQVLEDIAKRSPSDIGAAEQRIIMDTLRKHPKIRRALSRGVSLFAEDTNGSNGASQH